MSKNTEVRIFLKKDGHILNFMWAYVTKDGSVLMGFYGDTFIESIEKIFDGRGELIPGKHFTVVTEEGINYPKISFHTSGWYKLTQKIKKIVTDRLTIMGLPLKSIKKPTRMLEILIPMNLKKTDKQPIQGKDAIIDITSFPMKPLRCTVSCMHLDEFTNFANTSKIVDTSIIESSAIFEYDHQIWTWTFRISADDKTANVTKFTVFIPGRVSWPSKVKALLNISKAFWKKITFYKH